MAAAAGRTDACLALGSASNFSCASRSAFRLSSLSGRLPSKFGRKHKKIGGRFPSRLIGLPGWSLATDIAEDPNIAKDSGPVQQLYKGKKAVVVGAGPAGLVAAAYLAKHGFSVKVFEGRKDIRAAPVSGQRAYNIVLFGSTPDVLADLGVELPSVDGGFKSGMHAFRGGCMWRSDESFAKVPSVEKNRVMGTRNSITKGILNTVEKNYSANVDVVFSHPCTGVSFKDQKVRFEGANGKEVVVDYDLLIAADGSNSVVRKELQDFDKHLKVQRGPSGRLYMGVDHLKVPHKGDPAYETVSPGWISFAPSSQAKAAKDYTTAFAYSMTPDRDVHAVFGAKSKFFEVIKGQEEEYIDAVLPKSIPQEWKKGIVNRIRKGELARTPPMTFVNKFNGPRTILIGDAAHGVSPAMGLGCNMAITDGRALSDALCAASGDLSLVPQKFHDLHFQTVRSYQMLEAGIVSDGNRVSGLMSIWHFLCTTHQKVYGFVGKALSGKRVPNIQNRVMEGQLGSIQALNIIKRDILIGVVATIGTMFVLLRHVIVPVAKYLVSRFPIV